jgi:hypothetical protein
MAMIDPEQERKRLLDYYSRQMDGRLEQIATQAAGLSELAREVLREELVRRGLDVALLQPPRKEETSSTTPVEPSSTEPPVRNGQPPSDEFEKRNLVIIRKFRDLPEALLAQGLIDSAGIETFLFDDATVRMNWFWSNLLGGIKLLVDAENVEAANEILNQPIPEGFTFEGAGDYQQPRCPKCQSMDISLEELNKPIAYGSLFINLPVPIHRKGWICHSCKHMWRENETGPDVEST